jgi:hypothetical protein
MKAANLIAVVVTSAVGLASCNGPQGERPLSPRSMFSTGARYLDDARTLAIKGTIEFRADDKFESGDFSLFLSGPDSLSFLIEGPFKVDVFRMVVLPERAVLHSRDDPQPLVLEPDGRFRVPEYGIEKLSPSLLGVYAFPQYFLVLAGISGSSAGLFARHRQAQFTAMSTGNGNQVTMTSPESDLVATYRKARSLPGGFYPSEVEISDRSGNWRITLETEKVRKNARLPDKIWMQD